MTDSIVVSGMGFCTPLGEDPVAAIAAGRTALEQRDELDGLPVQRSAKVSGMDLKPWLRRRKDKKLMARPSQLALAAAGPALAGWSLDPEPLGIYLGVGWEPGDGRESEAALLAAQNNGRLEEALVAGPCRDRYPPLLPLKTLPNMALAHLAIHLGPRGENGAWSGRHAAGLTALRSAIWALQENRVPAALVAAADSWVSSGAVKALCRGIGAPICPQGEAGVAVLIETEKSAQQRGADIYARVGLGSSGQSQMLEAHHSFLGDCGAADGLLAWTLGIGRRVEQGWVEAADAGQPPVQAWFAVDEACACYPPAKGENA